jgi:UDP-N-acetylglucosamine 1-carboxyvinyltransferase
MRERAAQELNPKMGRIGRRSTVEGSSGRASDYILRITGGAQLAGSVCVSGSKNAALPEMAAALLTSEPVHLKNVPRVTDTRLMGEIITALGGTCRGEGEVEIDAGGAESSEVPADLGTRMRATILLLGALIGRHHKARVPRPGGDDIGARRVEQHLRGLRQMGARIDEAKTELIAEVDRLRGARIVFDLPTVTGTENILLAAVLAEGRTEIFNAAREPHVQDLCELLGKMGARIEGIGTERLVVEGVRELHGAEHTVIPDYLEAGTYALAVAAAGGELRLECTRPEDLNIVLLKLEQAGVDVEVGDEWFHVGRRTGTKIRPTDMSTWPHPGFPTDLQAQYMTLMTQADGETVISEYVHENRFQHVTQLVKMGAQITVEGRLHAFVHGPTRLRGTELAVPDIRSGAALVIAALCADGESVLRNAWHVARGYEDMAGKLASLGARIESVVTETDASAGTRTYE